MRLPRETTAGRIKRAAITLLALSASLSLTSIVPAAMRRAADTTRASSSPAIPVTVAAGGEDVIASDTTPEPALSDVPLGFQPENADPPPFTITLPDGWEGGEIFEFDDDATRSFVYGDRRGRIFVVNLDPMGSDFSADQVWRYRVSRGDRFRIASTSSCDEGEAMCDKGNGTFVGYAVWTEGGSATVGNHSYYFRFADANGENESTAVFRRILQSIRVHG